MRTHLLLIAALTACFDEGDEGSSGPDTVEAAGAKSKAKAKAKAKAPSAEERVAAAKVGAFSDDTSAALSAALKLLEGTPEDDGLWVLVEGIALVDPAAALSALPSEPPGGRAGALQLLKAEVALAADKPADALSAAQAAQADEPDAAAALLARAILAGAPVDEAEGEPTPGEALARWAKAANDRAAKPLAEAAGAVAGWRAAVLRAGVLAKRGDRAGALEQYASAASSPDPRAVIAANLGRATLGLSSPGGDDAPTPADVAGWAGAAATAAVDAGRPTQALPALTLAVRAHQRAVLLDEALALVEPVFDRIQGEGRSRSSARLAGLMAQAAQAAGEPVKAATATQAALDLLGDDGPAELRAEVAWHAAWASWALGRGEAIEAAAAALDGPRKAVAGALHAACDGSRGAAVADVDLSGLSDRDAAYAAMAFARIDAGQAVRHLQRAVASADASRDPLLAMQARLQLEDAARAIGSPIAAQVRGQLAKAAAQGAAGDPLRAELAARSLAEGAAATFPEGAPQPWTAVGQGAPASGPGDAVTGAVAAYAKGRSLARAGASDAAGQLSDALAALPLHRHGRLDTGTALDGSEGFDLGADLKALSGQASGGASVNTLAAALAVQEVAHRLSIVRADLRGGRDVAAELPTEAREALLSAVAKARSGVLRYHAGASPLPAEDFKALAEAEAAAAKASASFARLAPAPLPALADLRRALDGAALLSYAVTADQVYGVALTSQGGALKALGRSSSILAQAARHRDALVGAVGKDKKAPHAAGNALRSALLDPFMGELAGFGRYMVLAPGESFPFAFTTFPEQADGLRWLAAIRTMGGSPDLRSIPIPPEQVDPEAEPVSYNPDFLGLGKPATGDAGADAGAKQDAGGTSDEELLRRHRSRADMPFDLGAASRQFGDDFRKILVGGEATTAEWAESAPKARYIHISEVGAAEDGGLLLSDGTLSVADIRTTELRAQLVVVTAEAPPEVQLQRARAFLDAGAESVVVTAWPMQATALDRLFDGFYEALNQTALPPRPPARPAKASSALRSTSSSRTTPRIGAPCCCILCPDSTPGEGPQSTCWPGC